MPLIEAVQKDQVLLNDIASRRDGGDLSIWWLGQSGFLVQWQGRHLLFDPYLSDSLTVKYATTDKPHVRMTEIAVDTARLQCVDLVTSTHNHTDHLDAETLLPLMAANPEMQLLLPEANRAFAAERLACDPAWLVGMVDGGHYEAAGFAVEGVPAAHEELETDAEGRHKFMGYVARCGEWTIYHSGDTMLYEVWKSGCRAWGSISRYCRSMVARRRGEWRAIFLAKKRRIWRKRSAPVWSFPVTMRCSNSTLRRRKNFRESASGSAKVVGCCTAANAGAARS